MNHSIADLTASQLGAAQRRGRFLLVCARWPWPARRGDQLRAIQFAEAMAALGPVDLLVPKVRRPKLPEEFTGRILTYRRTRLDVLWGVSQALLRGQPLQQGLHRSVDLERQLRRSANHYDLVVVQMVRLAHLLDLFDSRHAVVDLIDALSLNYSRRAHLAGPLLGAVLRRESRALSRLERHVLTIGARATVVAQRDREALLAQTPEGAQRVRVVDLPMPSTLEETADAVREFDLVFTGSLGYWVNHDAITWWLREIWPAVRRARPGVSLLIAGSRARASLQLHCSRLEGVTLVEQPASLRAQVRRARVAIAPMRGGAGVPVKVLEAMAESTAVIASSWAAAGVEAVVNRDLLVADRADTWMMEMNRLLDDRELRGRVVSSALQFVSAHHGTERCRQCLTDWFRQIAPQATS